MTKKNNESKTPKEQGKLDILNNETEETVTEFIALLKNSNIPKSKREKITSLALTIVEKSSSFSGPIPPPMLLDEYEKIVPGAAKDIMSEFKEQSKHRRKLEKDTINSQIKQSGRGQIFAFVISILIISVSGYFAFLEQYTLAGVFGTVTLSTILSSFFIGKKKQERNLKEK